MIENDNNEHTIIAAYDEDGKLAFDLSNDMDNAWQIVKSAESKNIEIRNEQNLSIKQINHL